MLSPHVKLHKNCALCQKLLAGKADPHFLFATHQHLCFKSPFAEKWPGALMVVFKEHAQEQSEIMSSNLPEALNSLICLERAIKQVTKCAKINFVKFGNVTSHLHWHIIPRYPSEVFSQKSPWELLQQTKESLYASNIIPFDTEELPLYSNLVDACTFALQNEESPYFGCALFLRPHKPEQLDFLWNSTVDMLIQEVRRAPAEWEGLLMKRNYLDFAWDIVGGNANANEFPAETMQREVQEELGWEIKEYKEVCRQWRRNVIKGFVYIAVPTDKQYVADNPPRRVCEEVQTVKYFNLVSMLNDNFFADSVRGRIRAFLESKPDFSSVD